MADNGIQQLKDLLNAAVRTAHGEPDLLLKSDGSPREGNEQTIAFRVGVHLHELLKQTQYSKPNLDCEYNKHGDDPKAMEDGKIMRPDLMLHIRGSDKANILVVEFAGWWKDNLKIESDRKKLNELTCSAHPYKYKLGVLVHIKPKQPEYEYFILS